ncbi:uncharacterized protein TM35_000901030 [Trypanosoma theileri]|uniref:Mucin-like glycoprotein n=1 Tax=Trypanosoma theileri TaxID=67003 RepID=A0A1X0NEM2_9TRYP|nr:uncharacterized protein TM35_000901030 [Trypanosoma theileri]ORC82505.1 hypothetical protein TM35_000901030 [Trypanosoma theileri]
MMMRRVMCVLAVVLCCACGYTMTAAAAVDNDSPSGRGVFRGAVEVSCGAGGALRVRPAAESEWLTCGAGSRVSACDKYADLCRQRTARTTTTTTTIANAGQPKAVMVVLYNDSDLWSGWSDFHHSVKAYHDKQKAKKIEKEGVYHPGEREPVQSIYNCMAKGLPYNGTPCKGTEATEGNKQNNTVAVQQQSQEQVTHIGQTQESSEKSSRTEASTRSSGDNNTVQPLTPRDQHTDNAQLGAPSQDGAPHDTPLSTNTTSADPVPTATESSNETDTISQPSPVNTVSEESTVTPSRDFNLTQHSTATPGTTAVSGSEKTNTTSQPSPVNTVSEESTATPSRDFNLTQHSTATPGTTAVSGSEETNTTSQPSPVNTVSEESTATPSRDSNLTQQSTVTVNATAAPDSEETNSTTPQSPENTTTEAPPSTSSPLPNPEISSNIASTVHNKANVDSSVSPVWMRTAAPLLIVAVLVSATVY